MSVSELKYHHITEKIIGAAMKVHRYFGPGFPEYIYQRALMIELDLLGMECRQEVEKEIWYHSQLIGKRRLDVIVEELVLVECKARKDWYYTALNQVFNYLKVFKVEVGLLINFGASSLQFKRFILTQDKGG